MKFYHHPYSQGVYSDRTTLIVCGASLTVQGGGVTVTAWAPAQGVFTTSTVNGGAIITTGSTTLSPIISFTRSILLWVRSNL